MGARFEVREPIWWTRWLNLDSSPVGVTLRPSKTLTGGSNGGKDPRGDQRERGGYWAPSLMHTNTHTQTQALHTHACTYIEKQSLQTLEMMQGDSEKTCKHLSLSTSSAGKFSHTAKHKGPTSGNADSPLEPKPIRSLMQTCRAPLSFISPFNVRGLESDSITHPKERRGKKGKGKIIRGSKLPTCFWVDLIESRKNGSDWLVWAMLRLNAL